MQSVRKLILVILVAVTISQAVPETQAKRFDCRLFCKETGFHGMLGGCRCSFTLFTAKRAVREPNESERISRILSHLLPEYENLQQRHMREQEQQQQYEGLQQRLNNDNFKSSTIGHSPLKLAGYPIASASERRENDMGGVTNDLGDRHNFVLGRVGINEDKINLSEGKTMEGSLHNSNRKRREFEMDLDNGETKDFLRMPY